MNVLNEYRVTPTQCSTAERIEAFNLLISHPDTEPIFESKVSAIVEKVLLTSELKPIKLIAELETVTGLNDFADFEDDEREPNIPEKIEALKEEIQNIEYKAPVSPTITLEPTSKTRSEGKSLSKRIKGLREGSLNKSRNHSFLEIQIT